MPNGPTGVAGTPIPSRDRETQSRVNSEVTTYYMDPEEIKRKYPNKPNKTQQGRVIGTNYDNKVQQEHIKEELNEVGKLAGETGIKGGRPSIPMPEKDEYLRLRASGLSREACTNHFNISKGTLFNWLDKWRIKSYSAENLAIKDYEERHGLITETEEENAAPKDVKKPCDICKRDMKAEDSVSSVCKSCTNDIDRAIEVIRRDNEPSTNEPESSKIELSSQDAKDNRYDSCDDTEGANVQCDKSYAELLYDAIEKSGMTLDQIVEGCKAKGLDIHATYISKLRLGNSLPPTKEMTRVICDVLGCDAKEIVWQGYLERVPDDIKELLSGSDYKSKFVAKFDQNRSSVTIPTQEALRFIQVFIPLYDTKLAPIEQIKKILEEAEELDTELEFNTGSVDRMLHELFDVFNAILHWIIATYEQMVPADRDTKFALINHLISTHNQKHIQKLSEYASERGWSNF